MIPTDLTELTIEQAGTLIQQRRLSPVDIIDATLSRIAAIDDTLHAYIALRGDEARRDAHVAEQEILAGRYKGPLHGIPYALKDIFLTRELRTTANSKVMLDFISDADAAAHVRLRDSGAILLGKLNTYEFGMGVGSTFFDLPFPPARNPWNTDHFSGSTTTGAGVAVTTGMTMAALGTDSGGSVRLPASACGVVGVKPTYGRVSTHNIIPNAYSLDHVGTVTRSVADAALMLQVLAGFDPSDRTSVEAPVPHFSIDIKKGLKGLKIGLIRRFHERDVSAASELGKAIENALDVLRGEGATIVELDLSASLLDYRACMSIINTCEAYAAHRGTFRDSFDQLGEGFRRKMMAGVAMSAADYLDAQRWRGALSDELNNAIRTCDAIVCAGTMSAAPIITDPDAVAKFTATSAMAAFNLSGHPALSICIGFTNDHLPLGMQIATNHFDEAMLFRIAAGYQRATHWHTRRPPMQGGV
jgi:aspartyl-tRNA(Asn)/glutamyl-tRNA(Gln) amidotransferase subunit A